MRLAYGVFGYGRGHATRALSVLPLLTRQCEVLVLASGDAFDMLSPRYRVHRLPQIQYVYGSEAKRSLLRTVLVNARTTSDAILGGGDGDGVVRALRDFAPDVAICDCDPFVHHGAARLRIPRISFDHFGVLAFCRVPMSASDRVRAFRDVAAYRLFIGNPQRIVVSSFFKAPPRSSDVKVIGPLVREEVRRATPRPGEHLLTYFNNGEHQLTAHVEEALQSLGAPVIVYGTKRRGVDGNLCFRPPSATDFADDLSRATGVFSTAGNQLVGEAMHLNKPMLVTPENTVEQRVNGFALERLGFGRSVQHERIRASVIRSFLREVPYLQRRAPHAFGDATNEAARTLSRLAVSLSGPRFKQRARAVEFA
jgi:uncharacterized protein (TIGR00661 family)